MSAEDFCAVYAKPVKETVEIVALATEGYLDHVREGYSDECIEKARRAIYMCGELGCDIHRSAAVTAIKLANLQYELAEERREAELDLEYPCRRCGACHLCREG